MLVVEALRWANDTLKGTAHSPMLDAEVLLAAILRLNRSGLFTRLDRDLTADEEERFRQSVKRRSANEPVAHIVGCKEFYKRSFAVNRFALIPRPATETLVELAIAAAIPDTSSQIPDTLFADIGTGSGAIAVTLAAETRLPVIASDLSREALALAALNSAKHGTESLVDLRHGNLVEPLARVFQTVGATHPSAFRHLVLCANLPYLSVNQMKTLAPDVRDHEPAEALVAGQDGLDAYWALFRQLAAYRSAFPERLTTLIEIDPSQSGRARDLIRHDFPSARPEIFKDLDGFDRVVVAKL